MIKTSIKSIFLTAFVLVSATSCVTANDTKQHAKGFTIKATSNLEEKSLVIFSRITDAKLEVEDTVYVKKGGNFVLSGEGYDESTLYYLTFGSAQPPGVPLILENGASVKLAITKQGASYNVNMDGGQYNASMQKLYNIYTGFEKDMAAFNDEVAKLDPATVTEDVRKSTTQRYNDMINMRSERIATFVQTEPASPATYFAVKYLFKKPLDKLILIGSQKMAKELPESIYTKNLQALAAQMGPLVVGAVAPDINLKTPEGNTFALSELRGKVVLIDFWASWCGPCRRENPNVKAVYDRYKDKGFEIYGVSLDNNAAKWKAAIAKDGLTWKHVSDLGGWKSSAAQLYKVHSIPQTFLLDQDGRIVKAGFRSHELESLIVPLLNKK